MPNYEIYHYGVKGMKWGVRRSQDELDRIAGRAYKVGVRDDGAMVIKKGSKLHRMTVNPDNEKTGHAYASFIDEDVKGYRKEIAVWMDEAYMGERKTYDLTMKVTKDLILPSEITKAKTFVDLYKNNKIDKTDMIIMKNDYTQGDTMVGKPARLSQRFQKLGMSKDLADNYALFSMAIYNHKEMKDTFMQSLKDQGYNAMNDIEDALNHRICPIIVFERENTLKVTKKVELPVPFSKDPAWDKIEKDAKEARKSIHKYQKEAGIK